MKPESRDCAIVVSTCDGYSDTWMPFFKLFQAYWPDNPYPVYMNSETLDCDNDTVKVTTLKARSTSLSWTRRLKEALERIPTEYVILMLDDFFLCGDVNTACVEECLSFMRADHNMAAIYFTSLSGQMEMEPCDLPGLEKCSHTGKSKLNITLTIWRKSAFEYYLDHDESAWEFEANALARSLTRSDTFYSFSMNTPQAVPYSFTKYGLFAGKWFKDTVALFEKHNIPMDFSIRGFYEPSEFGTIPYVARQIIMDSWLVPSYSLKKDRPRIDVDEIITEGQFHQTYEILGAQSAAIWYPSGSFYGHVIERFKCTVTFESGDEIILDAESVYGNFSLYNGAMCCLWPIGFVYIILPTQKKLARITIEGYLNKHFSRRDLAAAYETPLHAVPSEFASMLYESQLNMELYLTPQTFQPFRFRSKLTLTDRVSRQEYIVQDGKDRFPGSFSQEYLVDLSADRLVRWNLGGYCVGYAIEDIQVQMVYGDNDVRILAPQYIESNCVPIGRYMLSLYADAQLLLHLPDEMPKAIRISGALLAPMPRELLRAACTDV